MLPISFTVGLVFNINFQIHYTESTTFQSKWVVIGCIGAIINDRPCKDPHERSLAHASHLG